MKILYTKSELQAFISSKKREGKVISLVPTMGALHEGHLSLIQLAKSHSDIVVCSIFVNPTQFNDPKDLEKYPRPVEADIALLESVSCDVLFMPTVLEMYPEDDAEWSIDLGNLDKLWEGEHRPGHFQGVTQIVHKLFDSVQPNITFFGQKDFQQVMVIQRMVDLIHPDIKLFIAPTIRNENGLALSSRNVRLSDIAVKKAEVLSQSLFFIKERQLDFSISALEKQAKAMIASTEGFKIEYLAICETKTLKQAISFEQNKNYVAIVAAWIEGIRLIDNMLLD